MDLVGWPGDLYVRRPVREPYPCSAFTRSKMRLAVVSLLLRPLLVFLQYGIDNTLPGCKPGPPPGFADRSMDNWVYLSGAGPFRVH